MRAIGFVLIIMGIFLVFGSIGAHDFYEECKAAADCVAGDPPSMLASIVKTIAGLFMIVFGYAYLKED